MPRSPARSIQSVTVVPSRTSDLVDHARIKENALGHVVLPASMCAVTYSAFARVDRRDSPNSGWRRWQRRRRRSLIKIGKSEGATRLRHLCVSSRS
jgi:hypothetical protein